MLGGYKRGGKLYHVHRQGTNDGKRRTPICEYTDKRLEAALCRKECRGENCVMYWHCEFGREWIRRQKEKEEKQDGTGQDGNGKA